MRILISSTQYPYHGGAATNAYAIIKELRRKGHTVCGLFFENGGANCDPDKIGGILKSKSKYNNNDLTIKISRILGGDPEVVLAKNYGAPVHCRDLYSKVKIIYLVSGSPMMIPASKSKVSAVKYLSYNDSKIKEVCGGKTYNSAELGAIKCSDAIILNSLISSRLFNKTYSNYLGSKLVFPPLDTSYISSAKASRGKSFRSRNIDVTFVCSNFHRDVKNAGFAKKLFLHKSIAKKSKFAIGDGYRAFANVPGLVCRGKIRHTAVMNYLARSRVVICPSYFDASPNVIREAIDSGCNVLVSKNCGWSENYGERSVCRDVYSVSEWARKLLYLCNDKVTYSNISSKNKIIMNLENYILKTIVS
ncbi:hypothetical protein CMI47_23050 [Candidatus Pacearchaeota archaeon]|nr:hypothetical protein [Candidatus Pacearchaeota archaeon]